MQEKVFVDTTDKCPRCRSCDIEGGRFQGEAYLSWQRIRCNECGYVWKDVYQYAYSTADSLPENEEDEVKRRVLEMAKWPLPVFPHPDTPEQITVLESFSVSGKLVRAVFMVNGLGYSVDFEECPYGRNTAYDKAVG